MKEIQLTQGKVALVDDEDFEELNRFKWFAAKDHHLDKYYARRCSEGSHATRKRLQMHRVILGLTDPKIIVDHSDGNGLNNQRSNLRIATTSQNQMNQKKPNPRNTSGYRGVFYHTGKKIGSKKWVARIMKDGKRISLGSFLTKEEAARAFDIAAKELFGEFCGKLNFE